MITSFSGKHRFLSNFWPTEILFEDMFYPTVEHAYQAAKTTDHKERRAIRDQPTPGKAKLAGRRVTIRPDWEQVKIYVMERLLFQKFYRQPMKELLLATGDEELIEGNTWNDRFWGVYVGKGMNIGRNELGKALMRVRDELGRNQ